MRRAVIRLKELGASDFANDKELAFSIQEQEILPRLELESDVVIDFTGVNNITQSFLHALVAMSLNEFGEVAYQHLCYRGTNEGIKSAVALLYQYLQ